MLFSAALFAQNNKAAEARHWADSVYKTLSKDERLAQLMIVRMSTYNSKTKEAIFYEKEVGDLIKKYNVGGICLFQGSPIKQAEVINRLQAMAKTPVLISIDAEWGVGMRMIDSVASLPKQMMLGAMKNASLVYDYGKIVADQCKRVGIQVNYAPVVDINNNPNNPVINDRSFGEDKYKVADFGIAYMKGMQDNGVMACAKHFPGHGDVSVDSHLDLPVINKTMEQLEDLEFYPFKKMFEAGVGSVMIAHLFIPAIDNRPNRATSLSAKNIEDLLRKKMGYEGLTFTDALEMQGVAKFFPGGKASVESLIAGNDMLCLPGDVPDAIKQIKEAISKKLLTWDVIEGHVKKVLVAKYQYGLADLKPINTNNITADLNLKVPYMWKQVAENAITLLAKNNNAFFPLNIWENSKPMNVAYVSLGTNEATVFSKSVQASYNAHVFNFDYSAKGDAAVQGLLKDLEAYQSIVIGIHTTSRSPASNFGISSDAVKLLNALQQKNNVISFLFGNAYAVKNLCNAKNLVVCYEDNDIVQTTALDLLQGKIAYKGTLPVTVCENFKFGSGIDQQAQLFNDNSAASLGFDENKLKAIDSIALDAIAKKAIPGCVIMAIKDGKIAYHKAFGNYTFNTDEPVTDESVYDMASVTKICATTISIMKLYDQGKLSLDDPIGKFIPWVKNSNKAGLTIKNILLHQAGLVAYIPFYKELLDKDGAVLPGYFSAKKTGEFTIPVTSNMYMRKDWIDTMEKRIVDSKLEPAGKYIYSDNDFIFLGKVVENISGMPLNDYVFKNFYQPMGLRSIGFLPFQRLAANRIVPTENEKAFRQQLIKGTVHDPGAAMFGGVAGHAGLFSTAYDIAAIMQMLLNKGMYNDHFYLKPATVELFTKYQSTISRRGYGFDKPEKDLATSKDPYPARFVSPETFGHTGFTGTCVWADPKNDLIYVFLSNRVNAPDPSLFGKMNVRPKIQDIFYEALRN